MKTENFPFDRAVPGVGELQPYQPGKPVEELERELGVSNAVKLASNENPWGCSPIVWATIREQTDIRLYPDANGFYLKESLAKKLNVDSSQITLGNGSNDVLDLVARAFVEPGDEVVFSEYAFLVYPLVTKATGGVAVVAPAHDWGHQLDAMSQSISGRTKVVFIANPNNPTGTYVGESELRHFIEGTPDDIIVVIDEAYFEYVTAPDYPDCLGWCSTFPNLVVTRTFSKIYGLAGLRVGYGVASAGVTDLLNRVRQPFNVNLLAQAAALAALEDLDHVDRCRRENQIQLKRLTDFCDERGMRYISSVANFVSVEFGQRTREIYTALLHQGVIVRPLDNYQMPNHLRITIGRGEELDRLLDALNATL